MYKNPFKKIKLTENKSLLLLYIPSKHIRQWLLSIKEGWKEKLIELFPKDYCYVAEKINLKDKKRICHKGRQFEKELSFVWHSMIRRCHNPRNLLEQLHYQYRGVTVCKEWFDFENFYNWAMSNGYKREASPNGTNKWSLDRIDVYGNYEPSNCRWTTWDVQARNKRKDRLCDFDISDLAEYPPLKDIQPSIAEH